MKLVDILARELKVFPESYRYILFDGANGCYADLGPTTKPLTIDCSECDDELAFPVYRKQWQAAVDALKAPEIAAPEWNGEGLPPVGVACEWRDDDSGIWQVVEILYLSKATALIKFVDYKDGDCEACYSPSSCQFRPIRTPEQIEQQEIQKIRDAIGWKRPQLGACPVEQMYLLGYRKFEIVDK